MSVGFGIGISIVMVRGTVVGRGCVKTVRIKYYVISNVMHALLVVTGRIIIYLIDI